ncbi:MAG: PPOX class F420-dependent oxidoreductase [Chloroflexota bacterium]|nr:PPOX class F420-dependent oxidoreductase [Chloroflexota bacterium]
MLRERTVPFESLHGHKYINLTTFRKNGQPVPTPVWFAQMDDKLVLMTMSDAGKVKRIRGNAQVEVAPCDVAGKPLGAGVEAMAIVVPPDRVAHADRALSQKYGITKMLFALMWRARGIRPVYIEISAM